MASFCYGVNKQCISFYCLRQCLNLLLTFAQFSNVVVFSTTMTLLAICWTLFLRMFGSIFLTLDSGWSSFGTCLLLSLWGDLLVFTLPLWDLNCKLCTGSLVTSSDKYCACFFDCSSALQMAMGLSNVRFSV